MKITKKVKTTLIGVDGNAFSILGHFKKEAKSQGWLQTEIDYVIKKAMDGDYHHLLATINGYCEEPDFGEGILDDDYDESEYYDGEEY